MPLWLTIKNKLDHFSNAFKPKLVFVGAAYRQDQMLHPRPYPQMLEMATIDSQVGTH